MVKVVRFVKNVTIILFMLILGLAYYELSDRSAPVTVYIDSGSKQVYQIHPELLFYSAALFMVLANVLISWVAKLTPHLPFKKMNLPNKDFWFRNKETENKLKDVFVVWVYGFALIINTLVILIVGKIWFVNRSIGGQLYEYGLLALGFLLALLLWIGFIFYRLRIRREEFIR